MSTIRNIAILCPLEHGNGVYIARGMATAIDTMLTEYRNECELMPEPPSLRVEDSNTQQNASLPSRINRIYPNPANSILNVEYQLYEGETSKIEIINSLGQELFNFSGFKGNGLYKIDVSEFGSGMYLVKFSINNKLTEKWKLIIQK